jgi:hypothetical protein
MKDVSVENPLTAAIRELTITQLDGSITRVAFNKKDKLNDIKHQIVEQCGGVLDSIGLQWTDEKGNGRSCQVLPSSLGSLEALGITPSTELFMIAIDANAEVAEEAEVRERMNLRGTMKEEWGNYLRDECGGIQSLSEGPRDAVSSCADGYMHPFTMHVLFFAILLVCPLTIHFGKEMYSESEAEAFAQLEELAKSTPFENLGKNCSITSITIRRFKSKTFTGPHAPNPDEPICAEEYNFSFSGPPIWPPHRPRATGDNNRTIAFVGPTQINPCNWEIEVWYEKGKMYDCWVPAGSNEPTKMYPYVCLNPPSCIRINSPQDDIEGKLESHGKIHRTMYHATYMHTHTAMDII